MMCDCPVCQSSDPLNQRMRPGVAIQTDHGTTLVDITPDFRTQFLRYGNKTIPTLTLVTHAHNDHIGGIGDYADLCYWSKVSPTIVSTADIIALVAQRYPYLINARGMEFVAADHWHLDDWDVSFHRVNHGANGYAYGIRFQGKDGTWAYMPDSFQVASQQLAAFRSLDLLILGTSYWHENSDPAQRSVYDVQEALALKAELGIQRMVLTHLSHDIDMTVRRHDLPEHVEFAYDGMQLSLPI